MISVTGIICPGAIQLWPQGRCAGWSRLENSQDSISIVSCEDIAHIIKKRCNVVVEPRDVVFRFKRWALREFPGTYQEGIHDIHGGKRADLPEMGTVYTLKLLFWRKNW